MGSTGQASHHPSNQRRHAMYNEYEMKITSALYFQEPPERRAMHKQQDGTQAVENKTWLSR
ncbi:hypothetical protein GJ744_010812 [Endocarpon pusillum]|uniref:Uncharacterized protein n=1 Tax=Endocarpon pusillum TaxID=364733 RepID=A0A8H7AFR2_9EURO|nr:hypothetical protein GJ744_010812 [Endocarpon pusillum]